MRAKAKFHPETPERPACWSVPAGRGCHACGEDHPGRAYSQSREKVEALLDDPPDERADLAEVFCSIHCLLQGRLSPFWMP